MPQVLHHFNQQMFLIFIDLWQSGNTKSHSRKELLSTERDSLFLHVQSSILA